MKRQRRPVDRRIAGGAARPGAVPPATILAVLFAVGCGAGPAPGGGPADDAERDYRVYVANESSDIVSRVRFGRGGAEVEKEIRVGMMPADLDGAHGLSVAEDGRHWYLTTAHGTPNGRLWKYETGTDEVVGSTELGRFPATIGLSRDGRAFVVNFNVHGDRVPSSVSAVRTDPVLTETARIETCVTPHGSRLSPDGGRHYSVCVHDDLLVEISTEELRVRRRMSVRPGAERELAVGSDGETPSTGEAAPTGGDEACSPTWAEPGTDGEHVYVACNGSSHVLEIDVGAMAVSRRFETGEAPYNLEATPDGRFLIATNKGEQTVSVIELESGDEAARIATTRSLPHGVVATSDSRYAFISNEAVGATRGTVDVIDLRELERVASVEVRHQPGGIDAWTVDAAASPSYSISRR